MSLCIPNIGPVGSEASNRVARNSYKISLLCLEFLFVTKISLFCLESILVSVMYNIHSFNMYEVVTSCSL